ncbi:MAG: TraR/DksA family transcriptional regulator [Proteobacteria bacterium]|nr:TraR/DksA family transcriptional regulator [Pseudomonadota bacterium]
MDQKAIRKKLLEELENLAGRSDRIEAHWRDEAPPADWSELAIHQENDEVIESLDERTQEQMVSIRQALRRMDAEEWDTCSDCGEEIQAARLEALPTTTLCVRCAEVRETLNKS